MELFFLVFFYWVFFDAVMRLRDYAVTRLRGYEITRLRDYEYGNCDIFPLTFSFAVFFARGRARQRGEVNVREYFSEVAKTLNYGSALNDSSFVYLRCSIYDFL